MCPKIHLFSILVPKCAFSSTLKLLFQKPPKSSRVGAFCGGWISLNKEIFMALNVKYMYIFNIKLDYSFKRRISVVLHKDTEAATPLCVSIGTWPEGLRKNIERSGYLSFKLPGISIFFLQTFGSCPYACIMKNTHSRKNK